MQVQDLDWSCNDDFLATLGGQVRMPCPTFAEVVDPYSGSLYPHMNGPGPFLT